MSQVRTGALIALALVVLGAVAWATLKPAPSSAATFTNRVLFVAILGATALFARRFRSDASSLPIVVVALTTGLFFLAASILFAAHLAAVLSLPLRSAAASYDFRLYSLLLFGVVALVPAILGLRTLPGLVRGMGASTRRATRLCLVLLALNVPLIPLQDFAVALSISGVSVLAALFLLRNRMHEGGGPGLVP